MITKHNKIISIVEIDPKKEAKKLKKQGQHLSLPLDEVNHQSNMNYLDVHHGLVVKER